jgi:Undecaprenyl-phosphate glucose phosphotransferase
MDFNFPVTSPNGLMTMDAIAPALNTAASHVTDKVAISQCIPRLADFSSSVRTSLVSPIVVRGIYRAFEAALVVAIGYAIAVVYVDEAGVLTGGAYTLAHLSTAAVVVVTLELLKLYAMPALTSPLIHIPRVLLGVSIAFVALFAGLFFLKMSQDFSRVWLSLWLVASATAIATSRLAFAAVLTNLARQGRLYRRAAIYGSGAVTAQLIADLEADLGTDIRICGVYDDRDDERAPALISGYPRLGGTDELLEQARSSRLDLVILSLPMTAERRLTQVAGKLAVLPVEVKVPARATNLRFAPRTYSRVGSVAMLDLYDKPITDWGTVSKWLFDKVIATVALLCLAPVMLAIAIAIRLDSRGPVMFRQKRYGFNNELIEVFKFRSMYTDTCDTRASKLVTKDDPRVTPVGRFIRKTSLDELPQLVNVLIGNLSLVGPRPHATGAKAAGRLYDEVVEGYFARHKVKPGITGWAQINGWRGETDTAEKIHQRVAHDLYYIENWSLFLDAYILLKTPYALLTQRENAY